MSSKLSIHLELKKLNRIDMERADYNSIKRIVSTITDGMHAKVGTTSPAELFFRGRLNPDSKPTNVKELGAPPADAVVGFQRCNAPGQPMFYAASKRITAILECGAEAGDRLFLSQWISKDKIPVNRTIYDEFDPDDVFSVDEKDKILHSYFDTMFTRRIHKTFSNDYKITSAISELLTSKFKAEDQRKIGSDGFVSLKYPSVADIGNGHNTVFHPSFARERLELLHVMELLIEERSGRGVTLSVKDTARSFPNGEIEWTGNPSQVPAARQADRSVQFVFSGERWLTSVRDDEPTPADIAQLLDE